MYTLDFFQGMSVTKENAVNVLERLEIKNWKVFDPMTGEIICKYKNNEEFKEKILQDLATYLNLKL